MELSGRFQELLSKQSIQIVRLTDAYNFKPFDCGNDDLNDFLFNDSKIYSKYLRYTTTVIETSEKIMAYYSLANDLLIIRDVDVFREDIDSNFDIDIDYWERFYEQVSYPAVKADYSFLRTKWI